MQLNRWATTLSMPCVVKAEAPEAKLSHTRIEASRVRDQPQVQLPDSTITRTRETNYHPYLQKRLRSRTSLCVTQLPIFSFFPDHMRNPAMTSQTQVPPTTAQLRLTSGTTPTSHQHPHHRAPPRGCRRRHEARGTQPKQGGGSRPAGREQPSRWDGAANSGQDQAPPRVRSDELEPKHVWVASATVR